MKKEAIIIFLVLIILIAPHTTAGIIDWIKEKIQLGPPPQSTDVRVQVGNVAPTIQSISAIPAVSLNAAPSITPVTFTFTARDSNGAADLNDATASANFNRVDNPTRTGTCSFLSQAGKERTYSCTINMEYFDDFGTWNVAVSIQDLAGLTGSSSSTFTVSLLRDISLSPLIINFPTVAPEDIDVISTSPTTITNNGNFEAPADGNVQITASDLIGETNPAETILASNFRSAISTESTICTTGTALISGSAAAISSVILPRGPPGSNTGDINYCLTLVPATLSTQFYSATGGNAWLIGI